MPPRDRLVIEPLDRARHDVTPFRCGKEALDRYIHHMLDEDEAAKVAIPYVLIDSSDVSSKRRVLGYFTLSGFLFEKNQARRSDRGQLGGYRTVPAILLGRLAVDREFQGLGLGSVILTAALHRALAASHEVGAAVVIVGAIDDQAAAFYEHQGFTRFRDNPQHLYIALATFAAAIAQ